MYPITVVERVLSWEYVRTDWQSGLSDDYRCTYWSLYFLAQFAENLRRDNLGLENVKLGITHASRIKGLLICLRILLEKESHFK